MKAGQTNFNVGDLVKISLPKSDEDYEELHGLTGEVTHPFAFGSTDKNYVGLYLKEKTSYGEKINMNVKHLSLFEAEKNSIITIAESDDLDAKMNLLQGENCINRSIPVEALEILSKDSRWEIRLGVISHINTTKEILENLALNDNHIIKGFMLDQIEKLNHNLTTFAKNADSILDILSKDENKNISSKALGIIEKRASSNQNKKYEVDVFVTLKNDESRTETLEIESHSPLSVEDIVVKKMNWRIDVAEYAIKEIKEISLLNKDEAPLNSLMKKFDDSKKSVVIVHGKNYEESFDNLKKVVFGELEINARVEEDNNLNLHYITFENNLESKKLLIDALKKYEYGIISTKEADLKEIKEALENINNTLLLPIIKDTSFDTVNNLVYFQPMTTWKKSEVNEVMRNANKLKDDFKKLDGFLNLEYGDDHYSDRLFHDLKVDFETNNFKALGNLVASFENVSIIAQKQLNNINSMLETTKGDDFDNVEIEQENESSKKTRKLR